MGETKMTAWRGLRGERPLWERLDFELDEFADRHRRPGGFFSGGNRRRQQGGPVAFVHGTYRLVEVDQFVGVGDEQGQGWIRADAPPVDGCAVLGGLLYLPYQICERPVQPAVVFSSSGPAH